MGAKRKKNKQSTKNLTKANIVKYAEELYMKQKGGGKHLYSLSAIAEKIERKFNKTVTRITVYNWSRKPDGNNESWDARFRAAVAMGVRADNDSIHTSEALQEKLAGEAREDYKKICKSIDLLDRLLDAFEKTHNNELAMISSGKDPEIEAKQNTKLITIDTLDKKISYKKYGEFRRRRDSLIEEKRRIENLAATSPLSNDSKSLTDKIRDLL